MNDYKYIVNDIVFENTNGKFNAKRRATAYAKKSGLNEGDVLEVRNETELDYIEYLKAKNVKSLSTHQKVMVLQCFGNYKDQHIPPMVEDIPFRYIDNDGIHYEWVVGNLFELNTRLVYTKVLFDYFHIVNNYLRLIYLDTDGTYKEFTLQDIETIRRMFNLEQHKKMLEQRKQLRTLQTYDRLVQLRNEGRITESQRKELYKLEEIYNGKRV